MDEDLRPEVTRTLQAMRDHGEREVVSELLNEIAQLRQLLRDVYPYIRQSDNPEARPIMKRLEKELDRK